MSKVIDLNGMETTAAVNRPAVMGAAIKIYLLGGSILDQKERIRAAGSYHLMKVDGPAIMALVEELEARQIETAG
jgi:hypothetical protein